MPGDAGTVTGPDVSGDQMLWRVYTAAEPSAHINNAGRTAPLGVEIQQTTFGFDRPGAPGHTGFLRYQFPTPNAPTHRSTDPHFGAAPALGGPGWALGVRGSLYPLSDPRGSG